MVLYKQSNHPDHDGNYHVNRRRAQDANLVVHQSCSDTVVLYDNVLASALDKVATFACEMLSEREPRRLTKLEATQLTCGYQAKLKNLIL